MSRKLQEAQQSDYCGAGKRELASSLYTPVLALNNYECLLVAAHLTSHVKVGMWPQLQDVWFDTDYWKGSLIYIYFDEDSSHFFIPFFNAQHYFATTRTFFFFLSAAAFIFRNSQRTTQTHVLQGFVLYFNRQVSPNVWEMKTTVTQLEQV